MASVLKWRGDELGRNVLQGASDGLTEFGLRCERSAKKRLQPHHGVETGTLRRSIHTAGPGYNWRADDVAPSNATPERGGQAAEPAGKSGKLTLELGTGLRYGMAVHQGFGSFAGYHYLTEAVAEERPGLPGIMKRHVGGRLR